MAAEHIAPVMSATDLGGAVEFWRRVLGIAPTFVDGERWAQFDLGSGRLALAGTDRMSDGTSIMVKVKDLDAIRTLAEELGAEVGEIEVGPHERRFVAHTPSGTATFYSR